MQCYVQDETLFYEFFQREFRTSNFFSITVHDVKRKVPNPQALYLLPTEEEERRLKQQRFKENEGVVLTDQDKEIMKRYGFNF